MTHTPEPWRFEQLSDNVQVWGTSQGAELLIHSTSRDVPLTPRKIADARLIAAAPELLAACENVLTTWWNRHYPEDVFDGSSGDEGALEIVRIRNMLQDALARARAD